MRLRSVVCRTLVRFSLAVLAALVPLGCTKISTSVGPSGGANPWTLHGVLRIGSYEDLDQLNPLLSNQLFVSDVAQMVFSGLIDYDDHGNPVPDVALAYPTQANGGVSKDGKTIAYHLRHNVKFSDGVPLTSADVKFTWQQIMNPDNNVAVRYPYDDIASIDTPDPYTVIVHLKAPLAFLVATFMRNGTISAILPKHLLEGNANLNKVAYNTHPIGSGPFVIDRWEPGVGLELKPNPYYWRGPPKLKRISYRIIPDQNTLLTGVRSHDIDFYFDAPEAQYALLKGTAGVRVTARPNQNFEHIEFNCAKPPLDDARVREAIAYAIDWQELAEKVYLGIDIPGFGDTPPTSWAFDSSVKQYPHDLDKAKALLAQAGWTPGADGILQKNGQPFRISITTVTGIPTRAKVEQVVQADLKDVGIALDIRNYHANILFATYGFNGVLSRGKFDMSLFAWSYSVPDPDDTQTLGPDQLPPIGTNYTFYADKVIGDAQEGGRVNYDRATRTKFYDVLQHHVHDVIPRHTIVWRANIDAVNTDMKNFKPAPAVSDFWNSYEWDI
jgi:peptide/nickel transport system substrate-binding protein